MSDLPRNQARNVDPQRARRNATETADLIGPGLKVDEDSGQIVPDLAGNMEVGADGQIEIRSIEASRVMVGTRSLDSVIDGLVLRIRALEAGL